ncbi:hypothetical protein ACIPSA_17665 [Streptomyces sp. NPDC086549]|uniref:hypothetical protein n=1 Tax=Streptomyces sp. NPDC086549 TaxID=3365752 RepID=UPI003804BB30
MTPEPVSATPAYLFPHGLHRRTARLRVLLPVAAAALLFGTAATGPTDSGTTTVASDSSDSLIWG